MVEGNQQGFREEQTSENTERTHLKPTQKCQRKMKEINLEKKLRGGNHAK